MRQRIRKFPRSQRNFHEMRSLPRVLSGIQPTGTLHIGNYIGALKQWVDHQNSYENYFCVVDLHAITLPHSPEKLRKETLQAAAIYLAAGIDPKKSSIFIQSHVSAHAELTWLLNCITPLSWLERMIQFKEKSSKNTTSSVGVGLLNYPILMAADIILYQTNFVPVGEDQRQHLELARDIVRRFNELYQQKKQKPVFIEPKGLILSNGSARIMSLVDGTMKMSKSHPNDASRINLLDSFEVIQKKIKRCKTDSIPYLEYGNHDRPEANNLLNIYQQLTGLSSEEITTQVTGMNWSQFKSLLTEVVIDHLKPIQENYARIMLQEGKSQGEESRGGYLEQVLCEGRENAEILAMETLRKAKDAMGFYQLPGRQGTERR